MGISMMGIGVSFFLPPPPVLLYSAAGWKKCGNQIVNLSRFFVALCVTVLAAAPAKAIVEFNWTGECTSGCVGEASATWTFSDDFESALTSRGGGSALEDGVVDNFLLSFEYSSSSILAASGGTPFSVTGADGIINRVAFTTPVGTPTLSINETDIHDPGVSTGFIPDGNWLFILAPNIPQNPFGANGFSDSGINGVSERVSNVPLPASGLLLLAAMVGFGWRARRTA